MFRLEIGRGGLDEAALAAGVAELARYARSRSDVLSVTVDTFAVEPQDLRVAADVLSRCGFNQRALERTYEKTLLLELSPSEEELMAGLHKSARRNIRDTAKFPVVVEMAESPALAEKLQRLDDETRSRTGGKPRPMDWPSMIRMSAEVPHLSHIATLRRTDREGPEGIVAYAWACMQGEAAQYSEAGSARMDDLKISTTYVLLWDLICWAKANGARYFDLGGITSGSQGTGDPLGGISDFKRRFSPFEYMVAEEWSLEPHPARAATARMVRRGAGLLRSAARRLRGLTG